MWFQGVFCPGHFSEEEVDTWWWKKGRSKRLGMKKKTCIKILFTDVQKYCPSSWSVCGPSCWSTNKYKWWRWGLGWECVCGCVGRCVLKGLVCWVHHSTHEQDGSWNGEDDKDKPAYSHPPFRPFPHRPTRGPQLDYVQILPIKPSRQILQTLKAQCDIYRGKKCTELYKVTKNK